MTHGPNTQGNTQYFFSHQFSMKAPNKIESISNSDKFVYLRLSSAPRQKSRGKVGLEFFKK